MLAVELAAGASSDSSAHDHGVIEHVIVLSGRLSLQVNDRWHSLQTGEGLRFQADCPHSYRNETDRVVRLPKPDRLSQNPRKYRQKATTAG